MRFEVVETIVLAFHRGTVVDQRGPSTDPRAPAAADMADQITGITAFPSPYTVRLRFGTGGSWIVSVLVDEGQVILFGVSLLPFAIRMSGWLYLAAAVALGGVFIAYAVRIHLAYSDALARRTFRYSILYLAALFAALLIDHYLPH